MSQSIIDIAKGKFTRIQTVASSSSTPNVAYWLTGAQCHQTLLDSSTAFPRLPAAIPRESVIAIALKTAGELKVYTFEQVLIISRSGAAAEYIDDREWTSIQYLHKRLWAMAGQLA